MAHIDAEEKVTEQRRSVGLARPRGIGHPQAMRVHEATTKKKPPTKQPPYEPRKPQTRARTREGAPTRHNFRIDLKELIVIPNVADRLKLPPKTDRRLGPSKDTWCEFHQAFGHNLRNCLALGHQLDELVRNGFLKEYQQEKQDHGHEIPVHGEVNTISGGFSGGGCIAFQRKKYARDIMAVEAREPDQSPEPDLFFMKVDLRDVIPYDNDLVVISVVTTRRSVHRILVDQESLAYVMFRTTFNKLQLSPDQLRPYDGCLYGFAGDQVEVREHVELITTFTDDDASHTVNIRYLVVNAPPTYNILLRRPALNRIGAVASTRHMKMKLPSLKGVVITIKSDQKAANKCYENSLKTKIGVCTVTSQPQKGEGVARVEIARERRPEPTEEVLEREIGGKKLKLDRSLS